MQQMEPEGYRQRSYEGRGSEAGNTYDDNFVEAVAQRAASRIGQVQSQPGGQATAGQRLGLAIVSVIMITGITISLASNTASQGVFTLIAIGMAVLGVFLVNVVFNRWWFN